LKELKKEIMEKIKKSKAKNDKMVKMVEEIKKAGVKVLRNNKWQIEDKLVLKEEKMYILFFYLKSTIYYMELEGRLW